MFLFLQRASCELLEDPKKKKKKKKNILQGFTVFMWHLNILGVHHASQQHLEQDGLKLDEVFLKTVQAIEGQDRGDSPFISFFTLKIFHVTVRHRT